MRKLLIVPLLFVLSLCTAQETLTSNGFNLESLCSNPLTCTYLAYSKPIFFPYEADRKWQVNNLEVAIKKTGDFLITGDLFIAGEDTAAMLHLEYLFLNENSKTIYKHSPGKFEFFNDPNSAEPIVISGKLPEDIIGKVEYVDIWILSSERVPYFEISSNCFQPCKALKLKDEIKIFKKKKK